MRLTVIDSEAEGLAHADLVRALYGEIYADPPQSKGPAEVAEFAGSWPRRCAAPGFRLVVAYDDEPFAMTFGHQLRGAGWWSGLLDAADADVREWPGRTFAIIEMMVRRDRRRRGVARSMHDALLAGRAEERVTLLVRPDPALPARIAYERWGYRRVGPLRPYDGAPLFDAMLRALPQRR